MELLFELMGWTESEHELSTDRQSCCSWLSVDTPNSQFLKETNTHTHTHTSWVCSLCVCEWCVCLFPQFTVTWSVCVWATFSMWHRHTHTYIYTVYTHSNNFILTRTAFIYWQLCICPSMIFFPRIFPVFCWSALIIICLWSCLELCQCAGSFLFSSLLLPVLIPIVFLCFYQLCKAHGSWKDYITGTPV